MSFCISMASSDPSAVSAHPNANSKFVGVMAFDRVQLYGTYDDARSIGVALVAIYCILLGLSIGTSAVTLTDPCVGVAVATMGADDSSALVYAGVIPTDVSRIAFIGSAWGSAVSLDAAQAAGLLVTDDCRRSAFGCVRWSEI